MNISVGILGIGSYLPEKVLTNADLEKMVNTTDEWIVERTGIKARHIAAPEQATSDMSILAAKKALADAKTAPEEIDLVIVATASPDHEFPSTACQVQDALGLRLDILQHLSRQPVI
jgi:3-oxoacyl-[acyl-carrier-protein] synthase-3